MSSRAWGPVLAWMVLIFIGSSIPAHKLPQVWVFSYDKVLHALEYSILGGLTARAAGGRGAAVLAGALFASIYGASDEFHQLFVRGRNCDWHDWVADTVGGSVGALAVWVAKR
ncbi:MAG TPA: VanZ family protein [Polyangia bacterium]|nr:VanZ family protein [Polyangia bacterium]